MIKAQDHLDQLLHLLEIEAEADRKKFRDEIARLSISQRIKKGYSWGPLSVVKSGFMVGDRAFVVVEREYGKKRDTSIKAGSPIRYYTNVASSDHTELTGVVHWIKDKQMKLVLNSRKVPSWIHSNGQYVDLEFDENSYKEMRLALQKAKVSKGRLAELVDILTGNQKPLFKEELTPLTAFSDQLNLSQQEALQKVDAAQDIAIIHGPPGTGKTTALVAIIKHLTASEHQILVCAPSNVAVDLLAEKLHNIGLNVVRPGHISRVSESLINLTLDVQVEQHPEHKQIRKIKLEAAEVRKQAERYKRKFDAQARRERGQLYQQAGELDAWARDLEKRILSDVLDNAQVICCTLTGAGAEYMHKRKFKTLIVDEAAQALEPSIWIALQRAKRIVMAGDPFQLPPTVKSKKAQKQGLSITMMERLLPSFSQAASLLNEQYRMSSNIMQFSNQYFYNNKLKANEANANQKLPFAYMNEPALRFIDTAGAGFQEKRNDETGSRFNEDEQLLIVTYLRGYQNQMNALIQSPFQDAPSIAILSPYRQQVQMLTTEIANDPILSEWDIKVQTIDGFQGQERDWVIISLVRDNEKGELGFLKDYRRMNVAMTRAKLQLVVVGNSAVLATDKFYDQFLTFVGDHGDYASAYSYMKFN